MGPLDRIFLVTLQMVREQPIVSTVPKLTFQKLETTSIISIQISKHNYSFQNLKRSQINRVNKINVRDIDGCI